MDGPHTKNQKPQEEKQKTLNNQQKIPKNINTFSFKIPLPKSMVKKDTITNGEELPSQPEGGVVGRINKGDASTISGGEWMDCLSASEIDKAINGTTEMALSAMDFYRFRRGMIEPKVFKDKITRMLAKFGQVYVPIHIRHHWLVMRIQVDSRGEEVPVVYDSAASQVVRKDVKKWFKDITGKITFATCMQQLRSSNECGVFVIANVVRMVAGLEVDSPPLPRVANLAHLRDPFSRGELKEATDIICARDFPKLTGGAWGGDLSNAEIDEALEAHIRGALPANLMAIPGLQDSELRSRMLRESPTVIPIWSANHWIAGVYKDGTLFVLDSAPRPDHVRKVQEVAARLGGEVFIVDCPRQPQGSNQCGLHVIVHSILGYYGIFLSTAQFPVLDLEWSREARLADKGVLFDRLFAERLAPMGSLPLNDQFVAKVDGEWFTGRAGSRRQRMTTVKGWRVRDSSPWSTVWRDSEEKAVYMIGNPVRRPQGRYELIAPNTDVRISPLPREGVPRRGELTTTSPAITSIPPPREVVPLPIGPQYQNLGQPRMRQEEENCAEPGRLELLTPEVLRFLEANPTMSGFHFSSEGAFPPPHHYRLRDVVGLEVVEQRAIPHLAKGALAASTINAHRQVLKGFQTIAEDLWELPLDTGLIEWYTRCALHRRWKGSTLETKMGATAGALRLLPLYAQGRSPIIMGQSILWAQAARAAHKRALHQVKRKAVPAAWDVVEKLAQDFRGEAGLLIMASYCSCARVGDACRLRREDVTLDGGGGALVTFRRAKTTMKRGAYAVPMPLPQSVMTPVLVEFIRNARGYIFSKDAYKNARVILRTVGLTLHSIRRGAIQRLALGGLAPTEIIKFSGHSSVEALISYLDDGVLDPEVIRGLRQGQILFTGAGGDKADFLPSTQDILVAFPLLESKKTAKLHVKEVPKIKLDELEKLDCTNAEVRAFLHDALQWVRDPGRYSGLMREGEVLKEERISPLNDEMMTEFLRVKAEKAEEEARAEVFIFGVTELKVGAEGMYFRKRPICEPKLNSLIAQNTLIHLTSIEENIKGARKGRVTAQVDFISYYDQIGLEKAVRVFFGVKWKGVYYYLLSLPMGLRVSVLVACAITWFLTSFKRDDVHINTFIDNVRFAGAEEEIIKAVLLFTERARAVGASLDKMPTTEEEARGILESEGDFLGIHFQYSTQRMRLTEKTVEKIRMINAGITVGEDITFKQFAVIMGLYNFATRVLKFQAWEVYHLFRRYREEASKEALFPSTVWGSRPLRLSPKEAEEVRVMEEYFLRNEWVSYAEAPKADVHIFSDACAEGWGGVMVKDIPYLVKSKGGGA